MGLLMLIRRDHGHEADASRCAVGAGLPKGWTTPRGLFGHPLMRPEPAVMCGRLANGGFLG
jgi:hypothetical protein